MDNHLPADSRASVTLDNLIVPFTAALNAATKLQEIIQAINTHLPPGVSYNTELRLRFNRGIANDVNLSKRLVSEIVRRVIGFYVSQNLPAMYDAEGVRHFYFMREDIIRWHQSEPLYANYFQAPQQEIITIEVRYDNDIRTSTMPLSEDQMVGIAYGLNGLKDNRVTLRSNITNNIVNISDISNHALIYRIPLTLATEKLKRPYQVDVLQPDGTFLTIQFINAEFMQGILSVVKWYRLPNQGKNVLWKNLAQFTREGMIPLEF